MDRLTLVNPGAVAISELGEIVFSAGTKTPTGFGPSGYFTKHSVIVKDGDLIDGQQLVLTTGSGGLNINSLGESVFLASYGESVYNNKLGLFTNTHLIVSQGDTIEGIKIQSLNPPAVINDSGQIAFVVYYADLTLPSGGTALFVATPT